MLYIQPDTYIEPESSAYPI